MNIAITFTDAGDAGFPEGYTIVFADADKCQINEGRDIEEVTCEAAGCQGCEAVHRRLKDTAYIKLQATGKRHCVRNVPQAVT